VPKRNVTDRLALFRIRTSARFQRAKLKIKAANQRLNVFPGFSIKTIRERLKFTVKEMIAGRE